MPYAPLLTPYADDAPCPRVEVYFASFAPGTDTVTVTRTAGGRQYDVQGAKRASTAGALSRIDYECPLNEVVVYRAEMFDAAGQSLGFTDTATLGEEAEGVGLISEDTWVHPALNPSRAAKVELAASTGASLSRPVPGEISYPIGRSVGVLLTEPRRGLTAFQFDVRATTLESADTIQAMIGGYTIKTIPTLCIRPGLKDRGLRIPRPLFLGVLDIAEVGLNVRWGGSDTLQHMVGDEVEAPLRAVFIPLLTAADLNAFYATAADLISDNATAAAVNRRYDLAGYASA